VLNVVKVSSCHSRKVNRRIPGLKKKVNRRKSPDEELVEKVDEIEDEIRHSMKLYLFDLLLKLH